MGIRNVNTEEVEETASPWILWESPTRARIIINRRGDPIVEKFQGRDGMGHAIWMPANTSEATFMKQALRELANKIDPVKGQ